MVTRIFGPLASLAVLVLSLPPSPANAEEQSPLVNAVEHSDDPVVVTAMRVEQSSFDVPVSIDAYRREQLQDGQPQVNLSEALVKAPGVIANTRQNYAQDLQISIRG